MGENDDILSDATRLLARVGRDTTWEAHCDEFCNNTHMVGAVAKWAAGDLRPTSEDGSVLLWSVFGPSDSSFPVGAEPEARLASMAPALARLGKEQSVTITRLTRERDDLRVDAEVLSDRYTEVRALAEAYIDIVNRTARALGIPEVDEAGASPSLHDVPERVAGVVDALRFAAECLDHEWRGIDAGPPLYGDQGVNQAHRRIRQALDAMHDEPADDDATQGPPGWGVCGKAIPGSQRAEGPFRVERLCMDVPDHDGPCRFDARADGGEVSDG